MVDDAVAPTCTLDGRTEGKHCSVCNEVLLPQETVLASGHSEVVDDAVAPTCTSIGWSAKTECLTCNMVLVEREYVPKSGHTVVDHHCINCNYQRKDFTDVDIYISDYGYNYLGTLNNGKAMQRFYLRLESTARAFHEDSYKDATTASSTHKNCKRLDPVCYGNLGLTYDEAALTLRVMMYDCPIYYWLYNGWLFNKRDGYIWLEVVDEYAKGSVRAKNNEIIYKAAEEYYATVETETSEYYIALAYHDMIISAINYAYKSDGETPQDAKWAHSVLGVLSGQGAVCEAYAKAFQLLLNVSGIENIYIVGDTPRSSHAWNLVQLDDGKWYWFDLTWDDTKRSFKGVRYNYFGVTDLTCVEWYDALYGYHNPNIYDTVFFDDHVPHVGEGYNYQSLPERSEIPFDEKDIIELRETFTVGDNTYAVIGYNVVRLVESYAVERLVIPQTVMYNDRFYDVISIGAMDKDGYFVDGTVLKNNSATEVIVCGNGMKIDMGAFEQSSSINSVIISDGIEEIAYGSFYKCVALKNITMSNTVKKIGKHAFSYCYALEAIYFKGTVAEWNAIEKSDNWHLESNKLTIYCTDGITN